MIFQPIKAHVAKEGGAMVLRLPSLPLTPPKDGVHLERLNTHPTISRPSSG